MIADDLSASESIYAPILFFIILFFKFAGYSSVVALNYAMYSRKARVVQVMPRYVNFLQRRIIGYYQILQVRAQITPA